MWNTTHIFPSLWPVTQNQPRWKRCPASPCLSVSTIHGKFPTLPPPKWNKKSTKQTPTLNLHFLQPPKSLLMLLSINTTTHTLSPTPTLWSTLTLQLPAAPFSIFPSPPSYPSSLPGDPPYDSRQSQCLSFVFLVLQISSTLSHSLLRHIRVVNRVELKWQQPCFSGDLGRKKGADLCERLLAKIKC